MTISKNCSGFEIAKGAFSSIREQGSRFYRSQLRCVRYKINSCTNEIETETATRTVIKNRDIKPNLLIPAGIKIGSKHTTIEQTNLQRMQSGHPPLIKYIDSLGNISYEMVCLHHLLLSERNESSQYFQGNISVGTLIELPERLHKKYHKLPCAKIKHGMSWRKLQYKGIYYLKQQYKKIYENYWKERAKEYSINS